jgi:hypothetical protein
MKTSKILILILTLFAIIYTVLFEKDLTLEEARSILADDESKFVEVDGMQVHYKREGKDFLSYSFMGPERYYKPGMNGRRH